MLPVWLVRAAVYPQAWMRAQRSWLPAIEEQRLEVGMELPLLYILWGEPSMTWPTQHQGRSCRAFYFPGSRIPIVCDNEIVDVVSDPTEVSCQMVSDFTGTGWTDAMLTYYFGLDISKQMRMIGGKLAVGDSQRDMFLAMLDEPYDVERNASGDRWLWADGDWIN
ncbi:MAG: hypothetical protein KDA60_15550, partial [Planctomycetales bacterium]|nr:hypothetical protein [Planctomycetales bacterium]